MSHGKLRKDKNCLNCGHEVGVKFCSNCGQENVENKRSFHYLFTHFIEDLTHYDGQLWGTIKNLLFRPGQLTSVYLDGQRQRFVPPVKLYIFISFLTFFLFSVLPPIDLDARDSTEGKVEDARTGELKATGQLLLKEVMRQEGGGKDSLMAMRIDSLKTALKAGGRNGDFELSWRDIVDADNEMEKGAVFNGYGSYEEYEAGDNPIRFIQDPVAKKFFELREKGVKKGDIYKNLFETSIHNLPKALFLYLPIFALLLWVFHDKKKWWYYDHGVFTLHYFSFLLVSILLLGLLLKVGFALSENEVLQAILFLFSCIVGCYSFVYFFVAHRKVYQSRGLISFLIGLCVLFFNYILFMFLLIGLGLVSFVMMH